MNHVILAWLLLDLDFNMIMIFSNSFPPSVELITLECNQALSAIFFLTTAG